MHVFTLIKLIVKVDFGNRTMGLVKQHQIQTAEGCPIMHSVFSYTEIHLIHPYIHNTLHLTRLNLPLGFPQNKVSRGSMEVAVRGADAM